MSHQDSFKRSKIDVFIKELSEASKSFSLKSKKVKKMKLMMVKEAQENDISQFSYDMKFNSVACGFHNNMKLISLLKDL